MIVLVSCSICVRDLQNTESIASTPSHRAMAYKSDPQVIFHLIRFSFSLASWLPLAFSVSPALVSDVWIEYRSITDRDTPGPNREVKKAVEAYWAGKSSAEELQKVAADVRKQSLESIKAQGVDYIPRYDIDFYLPLQAC